MSQQTKSKLSVGLALLIAAVLMITLSINHKAKAQSQQPGATAVQQAQPFYNCNQSATATGVANTAVTVTTVVPPAGQYVYLCSVYIATANNATLTPAAGPAPIFTSTNLQNNLVWWGDNSLATTGARVLVTDEVFPILIKAASPATAVTIVTSAGQATQNVRINITYFVGNLG